MNLSEKDNKLILLKGYEYLDSKYCYAKVGKNISIMQSQKKEFYLYLTKIAYKRGVNFDATNGTCIRYFKTIKEVFEIISILEKYQVD